jgi:hypothetical protein
LRDFASTTGSTRRCCCVIDTPDAQDADNNTLLHILASIPSPNGSSVVSHASSSYTPPPITRTPDEQSAIALRMTHLYVTLFPFLVDWSNSGGKTPLHVAAQAGNTPFISLLCDFGADVDLTDLQGNTPLHYASAWGHMDTVKVLLELGCQYATRNFEGFSASDFAYSETIKAGLQDTAREVFEVRRIRRKEEKRIEAEARAAEGRMERERSDDGQVERLRSGSVSTANSMGSGMGSMVSARSHHSNGNRGLSDSDPPPLPNMLRGAVSTLPTHRSTGPRGTPPLPRSRSDTVAGPTPSAPTSPGVPVPFPAQGSTAPLPRRSDSLPASAHPMPVKVIAPFAPGIPSLAAPLPPQITPASVGMRRASSAQAAGEPHGEAAGMRRTGSGTGAGA